MRSRLLLAGIVLVATASSCVSGPEEPEDDFSAPPAADAPVPPPPPTVTYRITPEELISGRLSVGVAVGEPVPAGVGKPLGDRVYLQGDEVPFQCVHVYERDGAVDVLVGDLGHLPFDEVSRLGVEPLRPFAIAREIAFTGSYTVLYETGQPGIYLAYSEVGLEALIHASSLESLTRLETPPMGPIDDALQACLDTAWGPRQFAAFTAAGDRSPPEVLRVQEELRARAERARLAELVPLAGTTSAPPSPPVVAPWERDERQLASATAAAAASGDASAALVWATRWAEAAPTSLEAHLARAVALDRLGAAAAVIEAADAGLALGSSEGAGVIRLLVLRAGALLRSGVPEAALVDASRAIELAGRLDPELAAKLAPMRWQLTALTFGPRAAGERRARLTRWLATHEGDALTRRALEQEGAPPGAELARERRELEVRLDAEGDDADRLHASDLLATLGDGSPEVSWRRARLHDRLGDVEAAHLAAALAAETVEPARAWLREQARVAAEALAAKATGPERLAALERVVRIEPGSVAAHVELAAALAELGLLDAAAFHAAAAWRCGVPDVASIRTLRAAALRVGSWRLLYAITVRLDELGQSDVLNLHTQTLAAAAIGDVDLAWAHLDALERLDPKTYDLSLTRQLLDLATEGAKAKVRVSLPGVGQAPLVGLAVALVRCANDPGASLVDLYGRADGGHLDFLSRARSREDYLARAKPGIDAALAVFVAGLSRSISAPADPTAQADLAAAADSPALPALWRAMARARLQQVAPPPSPGAPGPRDPVLVPLDAPGVIEALAIAAPGQTIEVLRAKRSESVRLEPDRTGAAPCLRVLGRPGYRLEVHLAPTIERPSLLALSTLTLELDGAHRGALVLDQVQMKKGLAVRDAALAVGSEVDAVDVQRGAVVLAVGCSLGALAASGKAALADCVVDRSIEARGGSVTGHSVFVVTRAELPVVSASDGGAVSLEGSTVIVASGSGVKADEASSVAVTRTLVLNAALPTSQRGETLYDAYQAAREGDVLALPAGDYGDFGLKTGIVLRGAGARQSRLAVQGRWPCVTVKGAGVLVLSELAVGPNDSSGLHLDIPANAVVLADQCWLYGTLTVGPGALLVARDCAVQASVVVAPGGRFLQCAGQGELDVRGGGTVGVARSKVARVRVAGDGTSYVGKPIDLLDRSRGGPARGARVHARLRERALDDLCQAFRAGWSGAQDAVGREAAGKRLTDAIGWSRSSFGLDEGAGVFLILDEVKRVFSQDEQTASVVVIGIGGDPGHWLRWCEMRGEPQLEAKVKDVAQRIVTGYAARRPGDTLDSIGLADLLRVYPLGDPYHELARAALNRGESLAQIAATVGKQRASDEEAQRVAMDAALAWQREQERQEQQRQAYGDAPPARPLEKSGWDTFFDSVEEVRQAGGFDRGPQLGVYPGSSAPGWGGSSGSSGGAYDDYYRRQYDETIRRYGQ